MTEKSFVWGGISVGDAPLAPYDDDEFSDMLALLLQYDRTVQGIVKTAHTSYSSNLEVTNPAGDTIRVGTGAAFVDGKLYTNNAAIDFDFSAYANGTYYVALRKAFAAQTVRAVIVSGVTQTDGSTWEIAIATVVKAGAGSYTITDTRKYLPSTAAPVYKGRQGGDASDWNVYGTTDYVPGNVIIQSGFCAIDIANGNTDGPYGVTFPKPFSQPPHVFAVPSSSIDPDTAAVMISTVTATTVVIIANRAGSTGDITTGVYWVAIGPE